VDSPRCPCLGLTEAVTELAERLQGLLVAVFGANDALVPIEASVTVYREAVQRSCLRSRSAPMRIIEYRPAIRFASPAAAWKH
jgi:hypothetical protein